MRFYVFNYMLILHLINSLIMKQIFTSSDLLRYLYKELNPEEEKAIAQQLTKDQELSQEFNMLLEGMALLQKAEINPSASLMHDLRGKLHLNIEEHSI